MSDDGIYKTSREIKVTIPAQELIHTLLDDIIAERVADIVTEEHDGNGIVKPGSVKVISRTPLYQDLTRFDGAYACHARYVADCYDAPKGMTTDAIVRVTLPNGVLCEKEMPEMRNPVFRIFLPYEVHDDATRDKMRALIRDQVVTFRSIQRYGGLGDKTIDVLGEFVDVVGGLPVTSSSQVRLPGKGDDLRVEDFHAPKGPDSDDPGVVRQHGPDEEAAEDEEDGEAAAAGSLDKESIYTLWNQYNAALAKTQERDAGLLGERILRKMRDLAKRGLWYDPTHQRYTAFLPGLDVPAEYPYYLYRPIPSDNLGSVRGRMMIEPAGYTPVAEYEMVVTNPDTKKNTSTVDVLQQGLPRRAYGVMPESVLVLSFLGDPKIAFQPAQVAPVESMGDSPKTTDHTVRVQVQRLDPGHPVGEQLKAIMDGIYEGDEPSYDLIVLDGRRSYEQEDGGEEETKSPEKDEPDVVLDQFIPTYPLVVDTEILVFTPIQATQIGTQYDTANTPAETLQSFLGATATTIGAHIQRPPGGAGFVEVRPLKPPRSHIAPVVPDITQHVSTVEHGWMSLDTHAALVGAIRALRPKTIYELGSWYGLSTRVMLGESKDTTIYAFDKFKAAPLIHYKKNRIGVEENFFLKHPRYETFAANVSTALRGLGSPSGAAAAAASSYVMTNKVVMVREDASKAVQFARSQRVAPEMIFIDFEKNTTRLKKLVADIRKEFPRAVIVGDDNVFDSVKRAVRSFQKGMDVIAFDESYIILPAGATDTMKADVKASVEAARKEFGDSEQMAAVREHILAGRITDVLRSYPAGESVTSIIPHTQAQMALHEALRYAKNNHPSAITPDVIQQVLDDSPNWENGSVNFCSLTPWDYIAHSLSYFNGKDTP